MRDRPSGTGDSIVQPRICRSRQAPVAASIQLPRNSSKNWLKRIGIIGALQGETGHAGLALQDVPPGLEIDDRLAREMSASRACSEASPVTTSISVASNSAKGHPHAAARVHRRPLKIQDRLVHKHPRVSEFQSDLARSHTHIGLLENAAGHPGIRRAASTSSKAGNPG